jgi:hypothetical protein
LKANGTLWNYVQVFRAHWLAAMSGSFSVPFTALAVFAGDKYQQAVFGALAFAAFWFAAFRVWKIEHDKVLQLEQSVFALAVAAHQAPFANSHDPNQRNLFFISLMGGMFLIVRGIDDFVETFPKAMHRLKRWGR